MFETSSELFYGEAIWHWGHCEDLSPGHPKQAEDKAESTTTTHVTQGHHRDPVSMTSRTWPDTTTTQALVLLWAGHAHEAQVSSCERHRGRGHPQQTRPRCDQDQDNLSSCLNTDETQTLSRQHPVTVHTCDTPSSQSALASHCVPTFQVRIIKTITG